VAHLVDQDEDEEENYQQQVERGKKMPAAMSRTMKVM